MADRQSKCIVALFAASKETVDLLRWMRGLSDVHTFIWRRFADLKSGQIGFVDYLIAQNPQIVIVDLAPPYLENWRFVQALCAGPAMHGRRQVLITTNRAQLDAAIRREDSRAIDIVESPDAVHQIATAIEPSAPAEALTMAPCDDHLQRVRDAYRDTPSLRVTPSMAQRLFQLESQVCVTMLNTLLDEGFLHRTRDGLFERRADRRSSIVTEADGRDALEDVTRRSPLL